MLMPWATAKPLNSFLNSGSTLKFNDFPLSLSAALSSPGCSVCLLANGHPLTRRPPPPGRTDGAGFTDFGLSCNLESQKYRIKERVARCHVQTSLLKTRAHGSIQCEQKRNKDQALTVALIVTKPPVGPLRPSAIADPAKVKGLRGLAAGVSRPSRNAAIALETRSTADLTASSIWT